MSKEIYLKAFIAALAEKPSLKQQKVIERAFNFGYQVCLDADDDQDEDGDYGDDIVDNNDDDDDEDTFIDNGDSSDKINNTEYYEVEGSSLIAALFYDYNTSILQVELLDGNAYDYYDVEPSTFEEFKYAKSKGTYFNKFKLQYDFDEA